MDSQCVACRIITADKLPARLRQGRAAGEGTTFPGAQGVVPRPGKQIKDTQ
jgi:hypothetical protein